MRVRKGTEPGSSPLTRGKLARRLGRYKDNRLIPAHAGKTPPPETITTASAAHPRSRGENYTTGTTAGIVHGSSPLTRGKLVRSQQYARRVRLIPAHAGKTSPCTACTRGDTAHPRSRGENLPDGVPVRGEAGSSPLTRGKPRASGASPQGPRLIPAHAGKTRGDVLPIIGYGAHPRSRGENVWS